VALVLAGAVGVLSPDSRFWENLVGGLCAALAIQLRPEAATAVLAVLIIALIRRRPRTLIGAAGAGLAIGLGPLALYNYAHFGTPAGPHVAVNLSTVSMDWWRQRVAHLTVWFMPSRTYMARAFLVFALGWALARYTRWRNVGFAVCCFIAIGLAFEEARRHEVHENFFRVFPVGLLAFLPLAAWSPARRDLWIWCGVTFVGCLIAAPNDGGGQWGPRYLQLVVPALVCLGLDGLASTTAPRTVAWATGAWVIAAGLFVSYQAVHELREAKLVSHTLVQRTAADAQGASFILTDVWWLATYHAAAIDYRRILFVESAAEAAPLVDALAPAELLIVTGATAGDADAHEWSFPRCTVVERPAPIADDPVRRVRLTCR
jgi:hypothetical protein